MVEHKYADVLRAIADGKPVEVRTLIHDPWQSPPHFWSDWQLMDVSGNFSIFGGSETVEHRVKPKEMVKKWRWVVHDNFGLICLTGHYYKSAEDYEKEHPLYKALQKIDASMIEVEAD
jgi:hypothetical protein